nr:MAG TPA: helix-turn-helix domain protein [Caudoviricetes sp.]
MKWSVKIFFDRELHRMHLRKSSLQNSSALVQTLFLQKSTEKSLLIPMRSIKSAQCYISRTISRRQKFFCKNRPIFGMVRDAEVRGGEEVYPLKNIEAERARAGMTRKELADSLNVTEQTLRMWTGGIRAIPSNKLLAMQGLFHCSVDYLLGLTDQREIKKTE